MIQEILTIYLENGNCYSTTRTLEQVKNLTLSNKKRFMELNIEVNPVYDMILDAIKEGNYTIKKVNTRGRKK